MNTDASTTQVFAEKTNIQSNVDKDATAVLDAKQAVVETTTAPVTECEKENAAEPVETKPVEEVKPVETAEPVEEETKPVETEEKPVEEVKPVETVETVEKTEEKTEEETLGKREAPEETEAPVVEEELKEEVAAP